MRPRPRALTGLAAIAALAAAAPAGGQVCDSQATAGHFQVTFIGISFNPALFTSNFTYCVSHLGPPQQPALSHWVLELGQCIGDADLVNCGPDPCGYQVLDPTTGVTGIKWDGTTTDEGETDCFELTLTGDWTERLASVVSAFKAGRNANYAEICGPSCATPSCGDGILGNTPGETCDPPGVNGCRDDCTFCGDGVLDALEECDDGNTVDGDGCSANCTNEPPPPVCGDGNLDPGEECDDGNTVDGDGCSANCTTEPPPPVCGDGIVGNTPGETCDPPGVDGCRDDCTFCGDGVVDASEACDDGNDVDTDDCRNDCTPPAPAQICGDGILDPGEACDDGNNLDNDGCSSTCMIEVPTLGEWSRLLLAAMLLACGSWMVVRRRSRGRGRARR